MLRDLQLRNFRCFESRAVEFEPGFQLHRRPERARENQHPGSSLRPATLAIPARGESDSDSAGGSALVPAFGPRRWPSAAVLLQRAAPEVGFRRGRATRSGGIFAAGASRFICEP